MFAYVVVGLVGFLAGCLFMSIFIAPGRA